MGIRLKVGLPMALVIIVLGVVGYLLMKNELSELNRLDLLALMRSKANQVTQAVDSDSALAARMAGIFSRDPRVQDAFAMAHAGNIDDPESYASQRAREALRLELAPALAGYKEVAGESMRLHFHLPNGRSLVRLWREKQAKRDGKWVDISDDLTSFRQTVLDVNRSGQPIQGIELGRGGFAIRGLAPVKSPADKVLGSVEVLLNFQPVLDKGVQEGQELHLFMNADKLPITTSLQDESKYPHTGDFVLVAGTADAGLELAATPEFLAQGAKGLAFMRQGDTAMSAFPIKDYQGRQIGVMVYGMDAADQMALISGAQLKLGLVILGLVLLPVLVGYVVLTRYVVGPISRMRAKIQDLAEDRADLKDRLDDSQSDEVGALATWFNRLMTKLEDLFCDVEGFQNLVNAVPDPIFAVDDDFKILVANTATEKLLGCNQSELKGAKCMDHFKTSSCNTDKCPIYTAKQIQGTFQSEIIDIGSEEKPHYIQPVGDLLKDCYGKTVGYVEVARNVTRLVLKEQENARTMDRIRKVNEEISNASETIARTTEEMAAQFEQITHGVQEQDSRVAETATAMEEMNATVLEVAKSASHAAEQADRAKTRAEEGSDVVEQAVAAIANVHELTQSLKENMGQLGNQAEGIGRVMTVISDIADQTNLLALNAAIEAARAGDAGRGFAVVADEVRKLAEKTMAATHEVGEAISAIQDGSRNAAEVMDQAARAVDEATDLATRSGQALEGITSLVNATTESVQSIATAAEEQSATSEEINRAVGVVHRIATETTEGMDESNRSVRELADLARRLHDLSASD